MSVPEIGLSGCMLQELTPLLNSSDFRRLPSLLTTREVSLGHVL